MNVRKTSKTGKIIFVLNNLKLTIMTKTQLNNLITLVESARNGEQNRLNQFSESNIKDSNETNQKQIKVKINMYNDLLYSLNQFKEDGVLNLS